MPHRVWKKSAKLAKLAIVSPAHTVYDFMGAPIVHVRPPFGSFFGVRSLSLTFPNFDTLPLFVFADFFDAFMVFVSFHAVSMPQVATR